MTQHSETAKAQGDRPALTEMELLMLRVVAAGAQVTQVDGVWSFESSCWGMCEQPCPTKPMQTLEENGWIVLGEDGEVDLSHVGAAILKAYIAEEYALPDL